MENSMMIINPYKEGVVWMFDDEKVGLRKEPFVLGMSEIIDEVLLLKTKNLSNKEEIISKNEKESIQVIFSPMKFPNYEFELTKYNDDSQGAWYYIESSNLEETEFNNTKMKGWLCPALLKYMPFHPEKIYISIKN